MSFFIENSFFSDIWYDIADSATGEVGNPKKKRISNLNTLSDGQNLNPEWLLV